MRADLGGGGVGDGEGEDIVDGVELDDLLVMDEGPSEIIPNANECYHALLLALADAHHGEIATPKQHALLGVHQVHHAPGMVTRRSSYAPSTFSISGYSDELPVPANRLSVPMLGYLTGPSSSWPPMLTLSMRFPELVDGLCGNSKTDSALYRGSWN